MWHWLWASSGQTEDLKETDSKSLKVDESLKDSKEVVFDGWIKSGPFYVVVENSATLSPIGKIRNIHNGLN